MVGNSLIFGNPKQIAFELSGFGATGEASRRLRGRLKVWVDGVAIWSGASDQGFEWSWDVLLEQLSKQWARLLSEEIYPAGLEPHLPCQIWSELSKLDADEMAEAVRLSFEDKIYDFDHAHNIAYWIEGAELSPFRVVKEGSIFIVDASEPELRRWQCVWVSEKEFIDAIEALGGFLADKLVSAQDVRSNYLRNLWKNRDAISSARKLSYFYGEGFERAEAIEFLVRTANKNTNDNDAEGINELRLAARMLNHRVGDHVIASILSLINRLPTNEFISSDLNDLSGRAVQKLKSFSRRLPYVQGQELAKWLRNELGIPEDSSIGDITSFLEEKGVHCSGSDFGVGSEQIDAIGVWALSKQPCILTNVRGAHAADDFTRRVTLAHELCHVLVDRGRALPALEVLGGRVPAGPERRANAFAAEFLCPMSAALNAAKKANTPDEAMMALAEKYVVSYVLAANQIKNAITSQAKKQSTYADNIIDAAFYDRVNRIASREALVRK